MVHTRRPATAWRPTRPTWPAQTRAPPSQAGGPTQGQARRTGDGSSSQRTMRPQGEALEFAEPAQLFDDLGQEAPRQRLQRPDQSPVVDRPALVAPPVACLRLQSLKHERVRPDPASMCFRGCWLVLATARWGRSLVPERVSTLFPQPDGFINERPHDSHHGFRRSADRGLGKCPAEWVFEVQPRRSGFAVNGVWLRRWQGAGLRSRWRSAASSYPSSRTSRPSCLHFL